MPSPVSPLLRVLKWLFAAGVAIAFCVLYGGGHLLIASDPQPGHVDAAIVLQGSMAAEKARIAGAINLLQRGIADHALLSVPKESYWGQSIPLVARSYLERNFGRDLAARVEFCETDETVNSTREEAETVGACIRDHHWESMMIVTSNYHTRRAGMIWRQMTKNDPKTRIFITGVKDPEFQEPWWHDRQSAKVWVMETTKLVWTALGGR
jgi:uncharacterized SAM-binding protein YcdF (DUF218 family)